MKKVFLAMFAVAAMFAFQSCENETTEEEIELQLIDPDEVEDPGDRLSVDPLEVEDPDDRGNG
ncbi:MAG: hypothetical protein AAF348_11610 [Bacteroidota bacterium]